MPFDSEAHFEVHLRDLIRTRVLPMVAGVEILGGKKGVDLCLVRNGVGSAIFFVEAKYFNRSKNHSMVSLGTGKGGGFQPATLAQRPDYLETHLRWVLGTATDDLYYFLSTAQVSGHLSGGHAGEKQNGFNRSIFKKEQGLTQERFIAEFSKWLRST